MNTNSTITLFTKNCMKEEKCEFCVWFTFRKDKKVIFPYGNFDRFASSFSVMFRYYGYRSTSNEGNSKNDKVFLYLNAQL